MWLCGSVCVWSPESAWCQGLGPLRSDWVAGHGPAVHPRVGCAGESQCHDEGISNPLLQLESPARVTVVRQFQIVLAYAVQVRASILLI